MVVLWVASAVGLLVVAPLVVLLAAYVIRPALECARYSDDILEHGVGITVALEPVPALVTTREVVALVTANAVDYVGALRRLVARS
jgi:beta-lactamase regulating signal transducer with metallopeptidase domain